MRRLIQLALVVTLIAQMALPAEATTYFIRADGGTRYDVTQVPTGQCDGQGDAAYPGTGVNQHCAWSTFHYLYDFGNCPGTMGFCPGSYGSWAIAGGDTVVVRSCASVPGEVNPSNPNCRLGWSAPTGTANLWCNSQGNTLCTNPTIPAGTSGAHTRILGGCAYDATPGPCNSGNTTIEANLAQLYGGFGLTWAFDLSSTQYVDFKGFELTTHNGACSHHGIPQYPRGCATSQPVDDFSDNGLKTNSTTANVTFQDVYVDGWESSGLNGPIGGPITMTRVFVGFNMLTGWNFDDGGDTPDGVGSSITASFVTMEGNGCKQQYPIVNAQFPALACWDPLSGGFGDSWSGQDATLASFSCNHCDDIYNTKDGFLGPHTQIVNLIMTNSYADGTMGSAVKWGQSNSGAVLFQNNLLVNNCARMQEAPPGASQNFALATGLPGSYLSDYCRAGGAGLPSVMRAGATTSFYGNTIVGVGNVTFQTNCGYYSPGNVFNVETNCTNAVILKDNNFIGYTDPNIGAQPALYCALGTDSNCYVSNAFGNGLTYTGTYNNEFGLKNGTTDTCGVGNITCVSPLLVSQPTLPWPGSETALDVFNPFTGTGNSFYPTSGSPLIGTGTPLGGLTADYYGTTRANPPTLGGVELAGTPTVATPTFSPVAGTYVGTQNVTISTATGGASLIYTNDGTTPTVTALTCTITHGTLASGAVTVASSLTLKAIGCLASSNASSVATAAYVITAPPVTNVTITGTVTITNATIN